MTFSDLETYRALRVAEAIERLPQPQKAAVLLRYCQQASLDEIAAELGKTKPAVAGLIKRGLAALRKQLLENDR